MKLPWKPASNAVGGAPCPHCGAVCEVRVATKKRAYTFCRKHRGGCGFECRWPPGSPETVVTGFEPLDASSPEPVVQASAPSKPNPSKEPKTEKENADAVREDEGGGFLGLRW